MQYGGCANFAYAYVHPSKAPPLLLQIKIKIEVTVIAEKEEF
jgi:hypothetical protein